MTIQELDKEIKGNIEEAELNERLGKLQQAQIVDTQTKVKLYYMNALKYYKQKCKLLEEKIIELENGNEKKD